MKVRVEPLGIDITIEEGETVMAAARRHGYHWPTICGGQGECTACWTVIRAGLEACPLPAGSEQSKVELLPARALYDPGTVRLACMLRPRGDVTLFKRGVRPLKE